MQVLFQAEHTNIVVQQAQKSSALIVSLGLPGAFHYYPCPGANISIHEGREGTMRNGTTNMARATENRTEHRELSLSPARRMRSARGPPSIWSGGRENREREGGEGE